MALTNYELWTLRDVVEHVLDTNVLGDTSERAKRMALRAILEAYRQVANARQWSFFQRRMMVSTNAQQTTGSLAYDHTGGSSERLVTLTDATCPTDVDQYSLMIERVRYEIDKQLSSTTFTLTERCNPGADIAAGTAYTLYRDTYPLPDDFVSMGRLYDVESAGRVMEEVPLDTLVAQSRILTTSNLPWLYAISKTSRFAGGLAIVFGPSPTEARTFDGIYRARPRPLVTEQYFDETVSCTSGSTTITGSGTAFTAAHAGAVIRLSAEGSSDLPTSLVGNLDDIENRYAFQGVIRSVTDATHLELEQAADVTLSGVKYIISDRIDLESGAMFDYFLRQCEANASRGREDWKKRLELARLALEEAAAADNRTFSSTSRSVFAGNLGDLAIAVNP